jgi:hypothetical protein
MASSHRFVCVHTLCQKILYVQNDEAINKYAVGGKKSTSFDVIMSHDELVPASIGARALYRERGMVLFFA